MGFWDKRMAGGPAPAARPAPAANPNLPRGMGGSQAAAAEHYMERYQPPPQEQAGEVQHDDVELGPGQIDTGAAIRLWKGDTLRGAAKANADSSCPSCGSPRYLLPTGSGKVTQNGTVYPARYCAECGFNEGRPEQGVLGAAAKPIGSVAPSRQGESPGWNPEPIASGL